MLCTFFQGNETMTEVVRPESVGIDSNRLKHVSQWLEDQVAQDRVAGASTLISRRGSVAYFETTGFADHARARPFEKDTVVRLYSMTKPVTTVAAMMLYEQGCFHLDDPVSKFIPEFEATRVWAGGNAGIDETVPMETPMAIHHLMTHTSGLTYDFMRTNAVDAQYREDGVLTHSNDYDLADYTRRLAGIPLICQPGSQWNYSVSIDVLGRLVEIWSGLTLQAFFQERIFNPLGMVDCGFHVEPQNHSRFAALYNAVGAGGLGQGNAGNTPSGFRLQESAEDSSYLSPTTMFSGGGGLTGTMDDYARFCQCLLNGGELNGARLLSPKTLAYMRRNQLPENRDMAAMGQPVWSETSYDGIGFGLGWAVVLDTVKARFLGSEGEHHWGGAASTFFWLDPVEDLYVIFLTQLMPSSAYPIRRELRTRIYQALVD
jgi:CubicO group peptidase (beta-lactamase class C family)